MQIECLKSIDMTLFREFLYSVRILYRRPGELSSNTAAIKHPYNLGFKR